MEVPITVTGVKGKRAEGIAREVEGAARRFLAADLQAIQAACNRKRQEFLAQADDKIQAQLSANLKSPPSVEKVRKEATPEFTLLKPESLTIEILPGPGPNGIRMTCVGGDTPHPKVGVFLGTAESGSLTLAEVTYHEMLHACGDYDRSIDGVVRLNWIGVAAVMEVLSELGIRSVH